MTDKWSNVRLVVRKCEKADGFKRLRDEVIEFFLTIYTGRCI